MKVLFILSVFVLFAKVPAQSDNDIKKFLEFIFKMMEEIAKQVHLDPDTGKNISEFLGGYNYPLESHDVITTDGYILTLHRIPYGQNKTMDTMDTITHKPVVFIQHGLASSSIDWLIMGPEISLPFQLVDLGYDVWLGNGRGNIYGDKHTTLNPKKDAAFWDYSFDEKGLNDLPASIDYVLNHTGLSNLTYIGHSQGTTEFFVMASEKPEYNDKINLMVALAPIAYMGNITGPIPRFLVNYMDIIKVALDLFNIHGIPYSEWISIIGDVFCNDNSGLQDVCATIIELFVGFDFPELNRTKLTVGLSHHPAGVSIKELIHYGQEIKSGYFRKYDYGIANLLHYGSFTPPSYKSKKITAPVAAFYGKNDFMAAMSDVESFINELPNVVKLHLIDYKYYNHFDFVLAINGRTLLYNDVVKLVNTYNGLG